MKNLIGLLFIIALLTTTTAVRAETYRSRLHVTGGREINSWFGMSGCFILDGVALTTPSTLYYLEADFKLASWLTIAPAVGWHATAEEAIASLQFGLDLGWVKTWAEWDVQPQSWSSYYLLQSTSPIADGLVGLGVEAEGWGSLKDGDSWSHGVGGHVQVNLSGNFALGLVLQARHDTIPGWRPDLLIRAKLSFF